MIFISSTILLKLMHRQIMDATPMVNEAIGLRMENTRGGLVCKLNIEKVYDFVN